MVCVCVCACVLDRSANTLQQETLNSLSKTFLTVIFHQPGSLFTGQSVFTFFLRLV